jgi:hypothetical protein
MTVIEYKGYRIEVANVGCAKKIPTISPPPLPPEMPANRGHLALSCLSHLAEVRKNAAKYWIDFGRLPLFID